MTQEHRDLWWPSPTVELAKVLQLELAEPLRMQHGGELPAVQIGYESWGELSAARDNVVLVVHPMTADPHASGGYLGQEPGWWEDLIGPGKALDTDRQFVVCPNLVGGCYGTTGPCLPDAEGAPWRERFPLLTPRDMMRVQRLFLEQLGVRRLQLVIGPSMGGMVAWEWAAAGTGLVDRVVVVAAPLVTTAQQIGMNWLQRRGIELDIDDSGSATSRFGQMVARGIGMISYRSPSGLEEKFGREWFKKPGATLADRGMFNIESWLRFHGKRITKRFDPHTWMLYSRAMDLHDLAAERTDLIAALGAVDCQMVVAGISTDNLYPPQDVHLGADMLAHLGKPVDYAEIRSLHGHDAFLLETDQIDRILRGADAVFAATPAQPARSEREVREVRVGVLGAGRVASAFAALLVQRGPDLTARRGLRIRVVAVADPAEQVTLPAAFERLGGAVAFLRDPQALVTRDDVDLVLDLTRGSDSSALVRAALSRRRPVVTPNKRLIHDHGAELEALALQHGVRLAWHDSLAAGWPLMYALERPLVRSDLVGVEAVVSAAGNVIYEQIADGADFAAALQVAVDQGLTEVDPQLDVSGWDAAQKLALILTRITRQRVAIDGLDVHALDSVDAALVRLVEAEGLCIRPVAWARIHADRLEATVRPMAVRRDSHLGANRGGNHVVVLHSADEGESVQIGRGAGTVPVATAVWNDLLGVLDPERSWTGRFPRAERVPGAPHFATWVRLRAGGGIERFDVPAAGQAGTGTPAEGTPAEGTPAEGTPAEGTPAEGTPAEGAVPLLEG